jgi:photosystem II stability/assembly factor-like uncharacterized protein
MNKNYLKTLQIYLSPLLFLLSISTVTAQKTWLPTNSIDSFPVFCLEGIGDYLYAGMIKGGLFKTADEGNTWTACNKGIEGLSPTHLIAKGDKLFVATSYNGVFVSEDDGNTWTATAITLPKRVFTLAAKGNLLFAGTAGGLYRSDDDGQTWKHIYHGYTSHLYRPIYSLLIVNNQLLAGSKHYLFSTLDDGATWQKDSIGTSGDIRVAKLFGSSIYLGCSSDGIYKTDKDALQITGNNWSSLTTNTPQLQSVKALAMTEVDLAIAAPTKGVHIGNVLENTGLPSALIASLAYHKGKLYAGTFWDGVWKYDQMKLQIKRPNSRTFQLYPNPTHAGEITLRYHLEEAQTVQIILMDGSGQQLRSLTKAQDYKGWYKEKIPLNGLAAGTYYCVLKDKDGTHTKKVVITYP